MKKSALLSLLLFSLCQFGLAQTALHDGSSTTPLLKELTKGEWSFFVDEETNIYFIDFELIKENLKEIIITDPSGKIVYRDELWDLPVNTIYEIDFNQIGPGEYTVELHSYTHVYRKEVTIAP